MSIIFTIITYLVAFFIGGMISCFTRIKTIRAVLLPISSLICVGFIEFYGKELEDFKLAQYAAVGIWFVFLFARARLNKKRHYHSKQEYESKIDTFYMSSYAVIIFLIIMYSGYFSWLFGMTSKVMIAFSAIGMIGMTLEDNNKNTNYNKYNSYNHNDKYTNNSNTNYNKYNSYNHNDKYTNNKYTNNNTNNNYKKYTNENKSKENNYNYSHSHNNQNNYQNTPKDDDPYEILGVSPNDDIEYIKKQYRKLAKKYHPDVCKDPNSKDKMSKIVNAYEEIKKQKL